MQLLPCSRSRICPANDQMRVPVLDQTKPIPLVFPFIQNFIVTLALVDICGLPSFQASVTNSSSILKVLQNRPLLWFSLHNRTWQAHQLMESAATVTALIAIRCLRTSYVTCLFLWCLSSHYDKRNIFLASGLSSAPFRSYCCTSSRSLIFSFGSRDLHFRGYAPVFPWGLM